jgi:acyl-coenzyme A thioesterase PaaI-like protein
MALGRSVRFAVPDDPRTRIHVPETPDELAHARLAEALLRIANVVYVGQALPEADLDRAAALAEAVADDLEASLAAVPDGAPRRVPWMGRSLSPQFDFTIDGDTVIGRGMLTGVHAGMPGFAHGGWISLFFDELLGRASMFADVPQMTGSLTVKFRKPTPLGVELVAVARREKVDGRRTRMTATLSADGVVTAEAEGLFVSLTREHVDRYFDDPEEIAFTRRGGS